MQEASDERREKPMLKKSLIYIGNFRRLQSLIQVLRVMIQVRTVWRCLDAVDIARAKAMRALSTRLLVG